MTKRPLALILLLAGCGDPDVGASGEPANSTAAMPASAPRTPVEDGRVECALDGAPAFARSCTIERSDSPRGRMITIRAPDGGFRRLLITRDGRGVIAADGAEPARVAIIAPDRIEVAIGRDRYRLAAGVRQ